MVLNVQDLAAAGAVVAAALADLHERGQVHGAVDAQHAVLGPRGAVELKQNEASTVEGGSPDQDVAALGRLLLDAMGTGDPFACLRLTLTARERQGWRRFLPLPVPASPAAALRELAAEAASATADGPPASTLSKRLARLAGRQNRPGRRRVPMPLVVGAAGLTALAAAGLLAWWTQWPAAGSGPRLAGPPEPPAERPAAPATDPGPGRASPPPAARVWPSPPRTGACQDPGGSPNGGKAPPPDDVDGDGCPDTVEVSDGIVRSGSRRWAVGSAGDVVVLGDWNCDRTTTPAVLRPTTGGVFVFDQWAASTEPQPARPVRVVPGAVGLEPRGCGHAAVVLSDGSVVVVDTSGRR